MEVDYKAGPWTIYKDGTAARDSPIGRISVVLNAQALFVVRRQSGEPLIRADWPATYVELDAAIGAADRAIVAEVALLKSANSERARTKEAEVARQEKAPPSEREQEEPLLEERLKMIHELRTHMLSGADISVGDFAEQYFMLAIASLEQAEHHLKIAAMHHRRDIASRGRLGRDK